MARESRISGMSVGQGRKLLRSTRKNRWLSRLLVAALLVVCGMSVQRVLPYANADDSLTPTPAPSAVTTTPTPLPATVAPAVTLVSVGINGIAGNGPSNEVALDGDGNVAVFYSDATNLIRGDTNDVRDVFLNNGSTIVRIPSTPQPDRASHAAGGPPAIDSSGNVVAFYSAATNLVPTPIPCQDDIPGVYVLHRDTGALEEIGCGVDPAISRDGNVVAFQSPESDLVPNDTNNAADIFVVNLQVGAPNSRTIQRVCDGIQPNGNSFSPSLNGDGSFVAFASAATNLVASDKNNRTDIFVASRAADGTYPCDGVNGTIDLASVSSTGAQGDGDSVLPVICADGSVVAFKSVADNLVDNDHNGVADVFARDRVHSSTERISVDPNGNDANDASFPPAISPDCRFVAFGSAASNLVRNDANNVSDVFVRDRVIGETRLVDVNALGEEGNRGVADVAPSISGDDLHIGFGSFASNLVDNDLNGTSDVFVALRPGCGNGVLEPGEQCDDGNLNDGDCCSSTCQFEPSGSTCPDDGNPCTTDLCNATGTCIHDAGNAAAVCRPAAGECDLPETCTGTSAECPPDDGKKPAGTACTDDGNPCTLDICDGTDNDCQHPAGNAGTVCRPAVNECDIADTCTGTSATCPADAVKPPGTACTDDGNVCTTDLCNGTVPPACVHAPGNAGVVCRPAAGECDLPEMCTGTSADCPPDDGKKPPGTACTDDGNPCTLDQCDGTDNNCQHPPGNPGSVCRPATNECDITETCTGASATCPADAVRPPGAACTDDGNPCTTDLCNGTVGAPACVHDPGNAGTVCRAAAGVCDVSEACTGTSADCPSDVFQPSTVVCRPAVNECDLAETCTGSSATCPADAVKAPGTACTDDGNPCTTDLCNGTVGAPACVHSPGNAGAVCRPAAGECDVAETCTGSSADCPPDVFEPQGTPCTDDGNACTEDVCPGDAVTCSHPAGPNGTPCDDGRPDTINDTCQNGLCVGQLPIDKDACNCNVAPPDRRTYQPTLLGLGIPLALIWWRRRFRS